VTEPRRRFDSPLFIIAGLVLAVLIGVSLRHVSPTVAGPIVGFAGFAGAIFMRLLQMIIVPLVFGTVCTGIIALEPSNLGRMGLRALAYFLGTTLIAACVGLSGVLLMQPGRGVDAPTCTSNEDCAANFICEASACVPAVEPSAPMDILMGMIPKNPLGSLAATFDLPGVIFFAVLFAIAIVQLGEPADPMRNWIRSLTRIMEHITGWIMLLAPVGIFGLILKVVYETGLDTMVNVGRYALTVVGGLTVHALIVLPALIFFLGKRNPLEIFKAVYPALLTAFSTASSSATLPLSLDCVENRADVPSATAQFVLPLGATVNMNGTALYEAVAALFIAQVYGLELTLAQQALVVATSVIAAVGAAGIPSAGLVTLIIVLGSVGLPLEGMALLLTVDRLLDMARTTVNVWGDISGAVVLAGGERATR
jgi:Na+/H+-dicarboxylate symporter